MNNTKANDHTTIAKASIASSEYHTMEAFGRALGTQARLGVGHDLLNVFGNVIGILLCKKVSKTRVSVVNMASHAISSEFDFGDS
jgi:hypothetical protein